MRIAIATLGNAPLTSAIQGLELSFRHKKVGPLLIIINITIKGDAEIEDST